MCRWPRLGAGGAGFTGKRVRPRARGPLGARGPLAALAPCGGHSLASFSRGGGRSRPDSGGSRRGLVWVEVLDRGQLERGMAGETRREGLWSP